MSRGLNLVGKHEERLGIMDEKTMKQIVMEAISDLPDKEYVKKLVDEIEIKVNEVVEAEI